MTTENRPACTLLGSALSAGDGNETTDKDEGRAQILVVFLCIITVKLSRLLAVHGVEVGACVIGPQWINEFLERRTEAAVKVVVDALSVTKRGWRTTLGRTGRPQALEFPPKAEAEVAPSLAEMEADRWWTTSAHR